MRIDVLILILGLACIFAGMWLIVGITGDVNRPLRELLAALFFVMGIYLGFDFVTDVRAGRRANREELEGEFDRELDTLFSRRRKR